MTPLPKEILITEEKTPTGGNYQGEGFTVNIPVNSQGTPVDLDIIHPHAVAIYSAQFFVEADNLGDTVEAIALPDTLIGTVTAAVVSADTNLTVEPAVAALTKVGYCLSLKDGATVKSMGRVLDVDTENNMLIMENAAGADFPSGSEVRQDIHFVRPFVMNAVGKYTAGESKIGGNFLPATGILRIRYTPDDNLTKLFSLFLESAY